MITPCHQLWWVKVSDTWVWVYRLPVIGLNKMNAFTADIELFFHIFYMVFRLIIGVSLGKNR